MSPHPCMKAIMQLFLTLAEESKTVDEVMPLADRLFHDECRMQIDGHCLNKPRIMNDMAAMVDHKVTMELTKVEQDEFGITYEYSVRKPREKLVHKVAKAMVRDGRIYHVDIKNDTAATSPQNNPHMRRATAPAIHGF